MILIPKKYAIENGNSISFDTNDGRVTAPRNSIYLIDISETTAELLSSHILSSLLGKMDRKGMERIKSIQIDVLESEGRIGSSKVLLNQ
jgi:hypothetical protein